MMGAASYRMEVLSQGAWVSTGGLWARGEAWGYLQCHRATPGPTSSIRFVHTGTDRVMGEGESNGRPDADIGMHAGWPTAEHYVDAATRAVLRAPRARCVSASSIAESIAKLRVAIDALEAAPPREGV